MLIEIDEPIRRGWRNQVGVFALPEVVSFSHMQVGDMRDLNLLPGIVAQAKCAKNTMYTLSPLPQLQIVEHGDRLSPGPAKVVRAEDCGRSHPECPEPGLAMEGDRAKRRAHQKTRACYFGEFVRKGVVDYLLWPQAAGPRGIEHQLEFGPIARIRRYRVQRPPSRGTVLRLGCDEKVESLVMQSPWRQDFGTAQIGAQDPRQ